MRHVLWILIAFVAIGAGSASANPEVSTFLGIETRFIRDQGMTTHFGPVAKASTAVTWSNGVAFNVFHSTGFGRCLENEHCSGAQEWDVEIAYNRHIGDWRLYGKASYFSLGDTAQGDGDVVQLKGRVQYAAPWDGHIRPYLEMNYQHLVGTSGGLGLTHLGADFSWGIAPRWTVVGSMDVTYDSVPFREHGWIARGDAGLWWAWTPSTQIGVWVKARTPITDFNSSDRQGVAGGVGLKVTWK